MNLYQQLSVYVLVLAVADANAADQSSIGWRGDGTGVFPNTQAVLHWDDAGNTNIGFRSPMPNWTQSSPIVIESRTGRPLVISMSEAVDWQPLVLAIDGDSGTELWRTPLDHLPGQHSSEKQKWHQHIERQRSLNRLRAQLFDCSYALAEQSEHETVLSARINTLIDQLTELGYTTEKPAQPALKRPHRWALGYHKSFWKVKAIPGKVPRFRSKHFSFCDSWGFGGKSMAHQVWSGFTAPTPVSDGNAIYCFTGYHGVHCLDRQGVIQWTSWLGPPSANSNHMTSNPILVDGTLVIGSSQVDWLVALDAATGKIRWQHGVLPSHKNSKRYSGFGVHSPRLIRLDGHNFVYFSSGTIFRISDGKVMVTGLARGGRLGGSAKIHGNYLWATDHIRGDMNMKEYCYKLKLSSDQQSITAEVVWAQSPKKNGKRMHITPAIPEGILFKDKIYAQRWVIDANNGNTLAPLPWPQYDRNNQALRRSKLPVGIAFTVYNDRYLLSGGKGGRDINREGTFWVFDLTSGTMVSENKLTFAPVNAQQRRFIQGETALSEWRTFGQTSPFVWKDRIYIRSVDQLFGIWKTKPAAEPR